LGMERSTCPDARPRRPRCAQVHHPTKRVHGHLRGGVGSGGGGGKGSNYCSQQECKNDERSGQPSRTAVKAHTQRAGTLHACIMMQTPKSDLGGFSTAALVHLASPPHPAARSPANLFSYTFAHPLSTAQRPPVHRPPVQRPPGQLVLGPTGAAGGHMVRSTAAHLQRGRCSTPLACDGNGGSTTTCASRA
jgi:hypothetical protein